MKTVEIGDETYALLEEAVAFAGSGVTPEKLVEELIKKENIKYHTVELL